jgi:hypothetical protein
VETNVVEWVPATASELGRRRRLVRTTDEVDVGLDTIIGGVLLVVLPLTVLGMAPTSIVDRLAFAALLEVVCYVAFMTTRQGLYLTAAGVVVWRSVFPRRTIPWSQVEAFLLAPRGLDPGRRDVERVAVATTEGDVVDLWRMQRLVDFETRRVPVARVRAKWRSYPALVDQLNTIARDCRDS